MMWFFNLFKRKHAVIPMNDLESATTSLPSTKDAEDVNFNINTMIASGDGAELVNQRRMVRDIAKDPNRISSEYHMACEKLFDLEVEYHQKNGKLSQHYILTRDLIEASANPKLLGRCEQMLKNAEVKLVTPQSKITPK